MASSVPHSPDPPVTLVRRLQWTAGALLLAVLAWAALAPLRYPTRELDLDLSRGARVPATVALTVGVRDVLLLRNRDAAPHVFGQVQVAPGRTLRLPFEQAGAYAFACDTAPGAQVVVRVGPYPDPGWERLAWRGRAMADAVRRIAPQKPED